MSLMHMRSAATTRRAATVLATILLMTLSACGDDEPVGGGGSDAVAADASDSGSIDGGDIGVDSVGASSLSFYVETAKGNALADGIGSAIFDLSMDKYDALTDPGFQIDVAVTGTNVPDGSDIAVLVGGKPAGSAKMTGGVARIEKVTIPCSSIALGLRVETTVSGAAVGNEKSVLLNCTDACKATLEPVAACLNKDADDATAGFQAAFTVTTSTPDCTHAYLTVTDTSGKVSDTEKVALVDGKATIIATLAADAAGLVGANASVVATVEDQAHVDRPTGQSASQAVVVTTVAPEVAVVAPAGDTLTLQDDADGNPANGVQTTLVGTATTLSAADVGAIDVLVDDVAVTTTTLKLNGSFEADLSFPSSKAYVITVRAKNGCGLVGEASKTVNVLATKAKLTITAPAAGSTLLAKDDKDGSTAKVYDTSMTVSTQGAADGTKVGIYCRTNEAGSAFGAEPVGSATIENGAAVLDIGVAIDTAVYGTSVVCVARDDGANPSESAEHALVLGLPAPCLTIQLPEAGLVTAATSLAVAATGTNLEGAVVDATISLNGGATFVDTPVGKIKNGAFTASVALQVGSPPIALPDGTYTIKLDATDAFGNHVADGSCSTLTRTFSIDRSPPTLKLAIPTKTVLDPVVDPDTDDSTLGYQTKVTYTLGGEPAGATSKVCITVNGFPLPCNDVVGNGNTTFSSVTLQPNSNVIVAVATDSLGNKSPPVTTNITLQSNAVVVTWVSPATNVVVASDELTFQLKVTNQKDGSPILGASGALVVNGKENNDVVIKELGAGVYEGMIKGLAAGDNVLLVSMTPASGSNDGVSPPLTVTLKSSTPSIALTTFKDGEIVNLSTGKCVSGLQDCITNVVATTQNVADGNTATLTLKCGTAVASEITAVTASGTATFPSVTLKHGGVCTLAVKVVDEAGQTATAPTASVTVDRVAPMIFGIDPKKSAYLADDDFNQTSSDGMQIQLVVGVAGLSTAATVTAEVFDETGKKTTTVTAHAKANVPDTGKVNVSFGIVTLPDGAQTKIVVTVTDLAGNSASFEVVVSVISDAAEVRLTQPVYVAPNPCSSNADCGAGVCYLNKCATGWGKLAVRTATVVGLGMVNGAKARICSDNGSLGNAPACATAGMKQVGSVVTFNGSSTSISLNALPEGLHTLVAEALPAGKDAAVAKNWLSSKDANVESTQSRRLLYDATPPTLNSVTDNSPTGVPAGCLSKASQSKLDNHAPGGSFNFTGTTKVEEATISILSGTAVVGTAKTTNKIATVPVKFTTEGTVTLTAVAVDVLGNQSQATSVGTYKVNTIPPSGGFLAPNKGVLIVGDSLDVAVGSSDADVEGQPVVLKDGTTTVGSVAMASGTATFADSLYKTLSQGSHTLTAILKDECANTTTVATIPSTVVVDTVPPTATISSPTQAQTFGDSDDASATDGGYQISVTFGTSGAKKWSLWLGTDCTDAFKSCAGFSDIDNGSVTADGGNEPAELITLPFGKTQNYVVRVVATDENGNKSTVDRGFKVSLSGCLVSVTGLPSNGVVNTSSCAAPNKNCASTKLALTVSYVGPCGDVDAIKLFKAGNEVASGKPANSKASLDLTLADADDVKVEAKVFVGSDEKGTSGASSVKADLTLPVVAFVAGTVEGKATPAGGTTALQGKSKDLDVGKNGHQLHLLLRATDAGLSGGSITKLQAVAGGTDIASSLTLPATFGADGAVDTEIKLATLAEDATTKVRATVVDAAGNVGTGDIDIKIDWTPPAAPVVADFGASDLNARRPFAKLNFKAVGDDGSSGGAAASYEVAYSRKAIADATAFGNACKATSLSKTVIPKPGTPGADEAIIVEGPDPRPSSDACKFATMTDNGASKYYFAVRAIDAAGNVGPVSNVVETSALRLRFAKISSTTAPWNVALAYSFAWSIGDVNGDGLTDFALGGYTGAEKFCVVYGHADSDGLVADLDIKTQTASTHTCFDNSEALGSNVAGPVDVNGDGIDDVVLAAREGNGKPREIHVYLGEKGKPITTTAAVKITNLIYNGAYGVQALAAAGNFNGDKSTGGLPIGDIAFTTRSTATTLYDRVMVVPGSESWSTASPKTIDIENASDMTANNVLTISQPSAAGSAFFGFSLSGVGNVLQDSGDTQYDDLAIQRYRSSPAVLLLKGRAWTGAAKLEFSATHDGSGSADATSVNIGAPYGGGANRAFGSISAVEFDGDGIPDLVGVEAHFGKDTTMVWMRGSELNKSVGKVTSTIGTLVAGSSTLRKHSLGYTDQVWANQAFSAGDFGDQSDKTAAVVYSLPSWGPSGTNGIGVRFALKRTDGLVPSMASYHIEDLMIVDPYNPGATTLGVYNMASVGDFNGDGHPDLAIATSPDGYIVLVY